MVLTMTLVILSKCSTSEYSDGYYTTTINQSLDKVYQASLKTIKAGKHTIITITL